MSAFPRPEDKPPKPRDSRKYFKRDFWIRENLLYAEPNFRLKKCAALVNELAAGRQCDLLDVGCGPAALQRLLEPNISYCGIDLAIQQPAPQLFEVDVIESEIGLLQRKFDFVVALGLFEYMGKYQSEKLREVRRILKPGGRFVVSYTNFDHRGGPVLPIYNNVQPVPVMMRQLAEVFKVESCFPVSHHWRHKQPGRFALRGLQMRMRWNIPFLSKRFAVEYFWLCSAPQAHGASA